MVPIERWRWFPVVGTLLTIVLISAIALTAYPESVPAVLAQAAQAGGQPPAQTQPKPAGYVGDDTCTTCHAGYDLSVNASKHGFKAN